MTNSKFSASWLAFSGTKLIAEGELDHVAARAKDVIDRGDAPTIQLFEAETSRQVDLDFTGTPEEVLERLECPAAVESQAEGPRPRGRPKLGVVAREVTLMPRHWEWLARQPGGASVTLRKLIEAARRGDESANKLRGARERVYRFMSPTAGDLPGFEEATRALFAGDADRFGELVSGWPPDVKRHLSQLATTAFSSGG